MASNSVKRLSQIRQMIFAVIALSSLSLYYILDRHSIAFNPIWLTSKYKALRPYVIAQSKFETGNYQSSLFKRASNAFGMRIPTQRKSLRIGEDNNYSVYANVGDSLQDLMLYFEAANFPLSVSDVEDYAYQLEIRGYYTAPYEQYLKGLKSYG